MLFECKTIAAIASVVTRFVCNGSWAGVIKLSSVSARPVGPYVPVHCLKSSKLYGFTTEAHLGYQRQRAAERFGNPPPR